MMNFTKKSGMNLRIILINTVLICFTTISFCQNSVQTALNNFVAAPEFMNAGISFMAIDVENGQTVASFNSNLSLPTASTAKLFSTASALEILGPDFKPETRIYIDGIIDSKGTLNGNLWIRGGGDVTLGSQYFNEEGHEKDFLIRWADTLVKMGIKSINGAVIADGSEFGYAGIPNGWSWTDMGNYYGAGPSGICVFDNMIRYKFKTGGTAGSKTTITSRFPEVPNLVIHNYVTSENVSGDNSYFYGGPFALDRFATGALPLNQSNFEVKGSLPDPEFQLAYELVNQLKTKGVIVSEGPKGKRIEENKYKISYETAKLLYSYKGQSVKNIAILTNMKSINLFAEGLVCLVAFKLTGKGSTDEGIKQIEKYWNGKISMSGLFLNDGSGLSRSNGISAFHYCELLKTMVKSKQYNNFYETLPVAGKSGTLTNLCKDQPAQGRVVAKSGTMSRIKSYAGYVNSKSGKKYAFAIVVNNFNGSSSNVVDKMEKVLNSLAVF